MTGSAIAIVLLGLLAAYLFGSIPTGFILGKLLKGIDIREFGSGNTGATNVFRVMGKSAGIAALIIDLVKGLLAVLLMYQLVSLGLSSVVTAQPDLTGAVLTDDGGALIYGGQSAAIDAYVSWQPWFFMLAGLLAVVGHSKSVWLGFSGGKSAATGLGVLLALAWPVGLSVASVFGVALGVSKTVSVGSIAAALSVSVFMIVTGQPLAYILLAVAGGLYVVLRHKSNISRLLEGTEPKTFGG